MTKKLKFIGGTTMIAAMYVIKQDLNEFSASCIYAHTIEEAINCIGLNSFYIKEVGADHWQLVTK